MILFLILAIAGIYVCWLTNFQPWFRITCIFRLSIPEILKREFSFRDGQTGTQTGLQYIVSNDGLRIFLKTKNEWNTMNFKRKFGMAIITLNQKGLVQHVRWCSLNQVIGLLLIPFLLYADMESQKRYLALGVYLAVLIVINVYEFYTIPKQFCEAIPKIMNTRDTDPFSTRGNDS